MLLENLIIIDGRVNIECSACGKELNPKIGDYRKCVKDDGSYYCSQCAKNKFKKFISFYEWCCLNLSEEDANNILNRWDCELNVDKNGNQISPKDISHGSNKKRWFKCLKDINHKSELKNINTFTNKKQLNIDCLQCNSINTKYPHLIKYLVNPDDANRAIGSTHKIFIKCQNCGHIKEKSIYDWIKNGFGCPKCSDGVSYSEKFLFRVLEQLKIQFEIQMSAKKFNCNNNYRYRYDFYIPSLKCIVETHGIQHYEEKDNHWDSLIKIQNNDKHKEQLAKQNNYNYIILDCRNSTADWIKNSIINSVLPKLLLFNEFDIDWLKCDEYACSSMVKITCDLWNSGVTNLQEIANILKYHSTSIRNYLKKGAILGWCNYNSREALKDKRYMFKKVICLTTNEVFDSILEASKKYNVHKTSISACCRKNENKSAGKHPATGEKLAWMFYDGCVLEKDKQI